MALALERLAARAEARWGPSGRGFHLRATLERPQAALANPIPSRFVAPYPLRHALDLLTASITARGARAGCVVQALPGAAGDRAEWLLLWTHDLATGAPVLRGEHGEARDADDLRDGTAPLLPLDRLLRRTPGAESRLGSIVEMLRRVWAGAQEVEILRAADDFLVAGLRPAAPSAAAALRIAADAVQAGTWSPDEALLSIRVEHVAALLRPAARAWSLGVLPLLARGCGVAAGTASGRPVRTREQAYDLAGSGRKVVLLVSRAEPEDVAAVGQNGAVVSTHGGLGVCAACAARLAGVPMVCGRGDGLSLDAMWDAESWITVDGLSGAVRLGEARLSRPPLSRPLAAASTWAGNACARAGLSFRVNADTAAEARAGRGLGARGVGLCRTERMLAQGSRLDLLRRSLSASDRGEAVRLLSRLGASYRADFRALLRAAGGDPVTIRLLDPSLGELRSESPGDDAQPGAGRAGVPARGLRGCRVGLVHPEVYRMQIAALFEAACDVRRAGLAVRPEVLLPMVCAEGEVRAVRAELEAVIREVFARRKMRLRYRMGAMIELPRAALQAGRLARHLEFLCFGTNDLTQTTWGLSREVAGGLFSTSPDRAPAKEDPFRLLDGEGVGSLMRLAAQRARQERRELGLGVCGEHAGDPVSVEWLVSGGPGRLPLDYLSCSPQRLPGAILAAAQALLQSPTGAPVTPASRRGRGR